MQKSCGADLETERPGLLVEPVTTRTALIAASGDDVFVRSSLPLEEAVRGFRLGTGVAWLTRSRRRQGAGWLSVVGEPELVPSLVGAAIEFLGDAVTGLTVPAIALSDLPESMRPTTDNLWDWFWTVTAPPHHPGEDAVSWAGPGDEPAIAAMLDVDSPRHSARPGDADVVRWCVLRDSDGALLACAAHVEHVPGVPHLASIVTRTDQRGRGLGGAITGWLTRRLLAEGAPIVTLGMYADNTTARRVYHRLGYTDSQHFASGQLPSR